MDITAKRQILSSPQRWLPWVLDPELGVLEYAGYQVDLEQMVDSAQALDWIFRVDSKWSSNPEVLAGLVHAIADILHPQATMCPGGRHLVSTAEQVMERVATSAAKYQVG